MAAQKNRGLGKGLEALFGDVEITSSSPRDERETEQREGKSAEEGNQDEKSIVFIDINKIRPNENQPRKHFDHEKIEELANSILEYGFIQPIVLRKKTKGYEIVAGERRYRAARAAGLREVPCIVKELTDEQNMLLAIIENMQREDLNPIEEGEAIEKMINTYGLTQEQVSKSLSKSRPYITNALRLLKLPEEIREMIIDGRLTGGHGRALISIEDENKQLLLAKRVVQEGLSVRDIEKLSSEAKKKPEARARKKEKGFEVIGVEEQLKEVLGTKVNLIEKGKKGKIEIEYYSREELERLIDLIKTLG